MENMRRTLGRSDRREQSYNKNSTDREIKDEKQASIREKTKNVKEKSFIPGRNFFSQRHILSIPDGIDLSNDTQKDSSKRVYNRKDECVSGQYDFELPENLSSESSTDSKVQCKKSLTKAEYRIKNSSFPKRPYLQKESPNKKNLKLKEQLLKGRMLKSRKKQERGEDDSCGTRKNTDDDNTSSSENQRSDCQEIRLGSSRQREIKKYRDDYEKDNRGDYEKDTLDNLSIISSKDSFSSRTTNGKYHDTQITGGLLSVDGYDEDANPEEDKEDKNREDENKVVIANILNGLSKSWQVASLQCENIAFSSEVLDELMIDKEHSKEVYAQYYKDSFTGSVDVDERDDIFTLRSDGFLERCEDFFFGNDNISRHTVKTKVIPSDIPSDKNSSSSQILSTPTLPKFSPELNPRNKVTFENHDAKERRISTASTSQLVRDSVPTNCPKVSIKNSSSKNDPLNMRSVNLPKNRSLNISPYPVNRALSLVQIRSLNRKDKMTPELPSSAKIGDNHTFKNSHKTNAQSLPKTVRSIPPTRKIEDNYIFKNSHKINVRGLPKIGRTVSPACDLRVMTRAQYRNKDKN